MQEKYSLYILQKKGKKSPGKARIYKVGGGTFFFTEFFENLKNLKILLMSNFQKYASFQPCFYQFSNIREFPFFFGQPVNISLLYVLEL